MAESEKNVQTLIRAGWLESIKRFHGLPHDEMALFDWYLKDTESTVEQMEASVRADIADQLERGDSEIDDSALVLPQYFIRRVRYSHVIYLASLGEKHLKDTYDILKLALGERVSLRVEDLQGESWTTLPKYFQAFGQFSIPEDVRRNIKALYDVRNLLAHQNGSTSKLNDQEVSRFRNLKGIEIVGDEIVIGQPFIEFAKSALMSLVACLNDGLGEYVDRSMPFVSRKLKKVK